MIIINRLDISYQKCAVSIVTMHHEYREANNKVTMLKRKQVGKFTVALAVNTDNIEGKIYELVVSFIKKKRCHDSFEAMQTAVSLYLKKSLKPEREAALVGEPGSPASPGVF